MKRNALLGLIVLIVSLTTGCMNRKEGEYTVLLTEFNHPALHAKHGEMIKNATEHETGWDDVYLVHSSDVTTVYRGPYSSKWKASRAVEQSRKHYDAGGVPPFIRAKVVYLPPGGLGPEKWVLVNRTEDIRWTLFVAEYFNVPGFDEREQYAVARCAELREEGYEAYYLHDVGRSYVTIGDFPEDAYQLRFVSATYADDYEAVPIAEQVVTDPALSALTKAFPHLATNGQLVERTETMANGKTKETLEETYITEIPQRGKSF
jgi:hypothetical protein